MGRFQEIHRHPIVDGSMRPDPIVALPPSVDIHCGILQAQKPVLDETLQSESTIECFDIGIVGGLPLSGEVQDYPVCISPQIQLVGGELTDRAEILYQVM